MAAEMPPFFSFDFYQIYVIIIIEDRGWDFSYENSNNDTSYSSPITYTNRLHIHI